MALPRGNSKTGTGKTLRLHFPLIHHRGLRGPGGHTAKVEVSVKEGRLGASGILNSIQLDFSHGGSREPAPPHFPAAAALAFAGRARASYPRGPGDWPRLARTPRYTGDMHARADASAGAPGRR